MTTNKPSAGAMRASTMLRKMRNIGLSTPKALRDCATIIDEQTGMPDLLANLLLHKMIVIHNHTYSKKPSIEYIQEVSRKALKEYHEAKGEQS